ncbi:MAG: prenyltransferase/squalene oxidase repeat-containing protein [Pirellulales bacterium]
MRTYLPNPARLLANMRQIEPAAVALSVKAWAVTSGVWYAASVTAHAVALSAVLLLLGKVTAPAKEGEAPAFESAVDTEIPQPELDHFEVGETPLEPAELNTETLSLVDAPTIDTDEQVPAASDALAAGGGGSSASGGIGGLDGLAAEALGPGPLVRGTGLGASGSGRGPGGGGSGNGFGARGDDASRKAMVGGYGGTKASERAVAAALNWLARHQNADGSWSLNGFAQYCKGQPCNGGGSSKSDIAATAMGLLPFLAAGQTHTQARGPYRRNIQAGLNWLISKMKKDGDLRDDGNMYAHGLAAITLCEAYALTKDSRLGLAAQNAIFFIEKAQIPGTGGWHYGIPPQATLGDTSVVGWQLMALKSAQMAGLNTNAPTFDGAKKWLKKVTKSKTGGLFAYNPMSGATASMTSVGLLCTQYMGATRDDPAIREGMAYLMRNLPDIQRRDIYYWYYATQVMHNVPGPEWDSWNRQMRRVLIDTQVKDGCAAGSWDPGEPTSDKHREPGGRLMSTSLSCLTLEVYYRYLPLYKLDAEDPQETDPAKQTTAAK